MRFSSDEVQQMKDRMAKRWSGQPQPLIAKPIKTLSKTIRAGEGIAVTIFRDPVSWARPRRVGNRTYMDPKAEKARGVMAAHLRNIVRGEPDAVGRWRFSGEFRCETRRHRDLDRLVSLVLDAADGIVYADDSQVDEFGTVRKIIGMPKGSGATHIILERIE